MLNEYIYESIYESMNKKICHVLSFDVTLQGGLKRVIPVGLNIIRVNVKETFLILYNICSFL